MKNNFQSIEVTQQNTPLINLVKDGIRKIAEAEDIKTKKEQIKEIKQEIKNLISHGVADIDEADGEGMTPLIYALHDPDIVEFLIEQGADIDKADKQGNTPLMRALDYDSHVAIALIDQGADTDLKNQIGQTPLTKTKSKIVFTIIFNAYRLLRKERSKVIPD